MTGKNPLDIDWGINPGMILPGLMDVATLTAPIWADSKLARKIVNRQITKKINALGGENHSEFIYDIEESRFGMLDDGSFGFEIDGMVWAKEGSNFTLPGNKTIQVGGSRWEYAQLYALGTYLGSGVLPKLPYQKSMMSNSNYYSWNASYLNLFRR